MLEFPIDTTRTVFNLLLNGLFDRYPSIGWVIPHTGAALPVLADRVVLSATVFPPGALPESIDLVAALRRLYYGVAGSPLPRALPALLSLVDADHLVYGSDFPFASPSIIERLATALATTQVLDAAQDMASRARRRIARTT